jgi:hypothetical protein
MCFGHSMRLTLFTGIFFIGFISFLSNVYIFFITFCRCDPSCLATLIPPMRSCPVSLKLLYCTTFFRPFGKCSLVHLNQMAIGVFPFHESPNCRFWCFSLVAHYVASVCISQPVCPQTALSISYLSHSPYINTSICANSSILSVVLYLMSIDFTECRFYISRSTDSATWWA